MERECKLSFGKFEVKERMEGARNFSIVVSAIFIFWFGAGSRGYGKSFSEIVNAGILDICILLVGLPSLIFVAYYYLVYSQYAEEGYLLISEREIEVYYWGGNKKVIELKDLVEHSIETGELLSFEQTKGSLLRLVLKKENEKFEFTCFCEENRVGDTIKTWEKYLTKPMLVA